MNSLPRGRISGIPKVFPYVCYKTVKTVTGVVFSLGPFITVVIFPLIYYFLLSYLFDIENYVMMKHIFLAEGSCILFKSITLDLYSLRR